MYTKEEILNQFELYDTGRGTEGIGRWLTPSTDGRVFQRLGDIDDNPLSMEELNQLLILANEARLSRPFFEYYWLHAPKHPYKVQLIEGFQKRWIEDNRQRILSLDHLRWGLHRLYVDGLLFFGNVRTAYRDLRAMSKAELEKFFLKRRFDTDLLKQRGPALSVMQVADKDRYLIAEQACKSYGDNPFEVSALKTALLEAWQGHPRAGSVSVRDIIAGEHIKAKYPDEQKQFEFSLHDILGVQISSEEELEKAYEGLAQRFDETRKAALANTELYLSAAPDLDVYVATSMRTPSDFVKMAEVCRALSDDARLGELNVRVFDPTLSATKGHEDKGLVECLMVKCTKTLVYCAGESDSYGKGAEAAMALSLGKPVIFYCDQTQRSRFMRDVHPLSRLIEFKTGIAVGAMVVDKPEDVSEILCRIFENSLQYELVQHQTRQGYLRLIETESESVVRFQTNDKLLTETFWNHYQEPKPE